MRISDWSSDVCSSSLDLRLRLAWLAVIALCAALMLLSGSRGPLLALAAALAVGFAMADRRMALTVAALVVAGIGAGVLFDLYPIELIYLRAQRGHFDIWQQTLAAIAERPRLGPGRLAQMQTELSFHPGRAPPNLPPGHPIHVGWRHTPLPGPLCLPAAGSSGRTS